MDPMSPRERFQRTMRRSTDRPHDPHPGHWRIGRRSPGRTSAKFQAITGAAHPADYFDYDIRVVSPPLTPGASDFRMFHPGAPAEADIR